MMKKWAVKGKKREGEHGTTDTDRQSRPFQIIFVLASSYFASLACEGGKNPSKLAAQQNKSPSVISLLLFLLLSTTLRAIAGDVHRAKKTEMEERFFLCAGS